MSRDETTWPQAPSSLEILRESVSLLKESRSLVASALETQQDSRTKLVQVLQLLEQVEQALKHGIAREIAPLKERLDSLEGRVDALERVA
jgi:5-methylcytosine-specific restriction endonuclease McrBC regulatory subunit McrC